MLFRIVANCWLETQSKNTLDRLTIIFFNHITLNHGSSTKQIDHVLVSRYGVFVIETKNYKGWIFANPKHDSWTQVLFRAKFKFQNPIHQNLRHVNAVKELLDFLPEHAIKSAVVFTGVAEFKSDLPTGVYILPNCWHIWKAIQKNLCL